MSTENKFLQSFSPKPIYWALLVIYAIAVFYGISNHEPWRDEAQSWLLVRDLDFTGLLKILPAEGHPPLWYLIMFPFAKAGCGYMVQGYITGVLMIGAVFLLLFKTKLPIYLKIALVFSYFFIYEYSVIARSYCLVALFIAAIIALYPSRFEKPWLFALCVVGLFNSQLLAFTFAASVAGMYLIDAFQEKKWNQKTTGAFALMCIGGAYLIPYIVLSSPTSSSFQNRIADHGEQVTNAIGNAFFTYGDQTYALLAFVAICLLLLARPKAFLLLAGGFAGFVYILAYKYTGTVRHQGIIFLDVIGAIGIAQYYANDKLSFKVKFDVTTLASIVLTVTLIFQVKMGFNVFSQDLEAEFSDAKGASEFLMDHNLTGNTIVGSRAYAASAVLPFLPKGTQFYYPECKRMGSYLIYDDCYMENMFALNNDYVAYIADSTFRKTGRQTVLLFNSPIQAPELNMLWQLVYESPAQPMKKDESFFIYQHK